MTMYAFRSERILSFSFLIFHIKVHKTLHFLASFQNFTQQKAAPQGSTVDDWASNCVRLTWKQPTDTPLKRFYTDVSEFFTLRDTKRYICSAMNPETSAQNQHQVSSISPTATHPTKTTPALQGREALWNIFSRG